MTRYYVCAPSEYARVEGPVLFGGCVSPRGPDCDEFGDQPLAEIGRVWVAGLPPERDLSLPRTPAAVADRGAPGPTRKRPVSRARGLGAPRGDEEELYRDHHRRLVSSVSWAVEADPAVIEDACARAWEQLIRHQPQRTERIFAWLRTVAIREAWALARREQREAGPGADDPREVAAGQPAPLDVDGALETRAALEALAALRERERRYLALKAAGSPTRR
jgi:DNA-directed RNA polymerase specialized sigma24 family protein